MKSKEYNWKDIKVMFGGKEINTIPIIDYKADHTNVIEYNMTFPSKRDVLKTLKNAGIDLTYGRDLTKPIGYNESDFKISDTNAFQGLVNSISFEEWNNL